MELWTDQAIVFIERCFRLRVPTVRPLLLPSRLSPTVNPSPGVSVNWLEDLSVLPVDLLAIRFPT